MQLIIAFCVFALLAGAAWWLYTPDKSRLALEAAYFTPADHYLDIDGSRLRLRDTGPHDAPAIILLHGFGGSLETWQPWAAKLSANYRVIRFDLPGFGLTGPDATGDYSDARTVQILRLLMDRLGLQRTDLIGNSLGGKIAWNFAAECPGRVDKLVLISPDGFASPGFDYNKKPELPAMLKLLPYVLPRFMLRMNLAVAYANPKSLSAATLTRYRDMMLAPGDRRAMLARMAQVMLTEPAPQLRRITAPTLILWGDQDKMIPFSNSADYLKHIPHATLVALPGLGHVPFEEAPEVSLPPVEAFLTR